MCPAHGAPPFQACKHATLQGAPLGAAAAHAADAYDARGCGVEEAPGLGGVRLHDEAARQLGASAGVATGGDGDASLSSASARVWRHFAVRVLKHHLARRLWHATRKGPKGHGLAHLSPLICRSCSCMVSPESALHDVPLARAQSSGSGDSATPSKAAAGPEPQLGTGTAAKQIPSTL